MIEPDADAPSGVLLTEIVHSIALAADLGLGQPLDHVLRSCALAMRFAEHLGLSEEERTSAYWTALFITAGCTGVSYELAKIFGDDIALRADLASVTSPFMLLQVMLSRAGSGRSLLGRTGVRAKLLVTKAHAVEETLIAHCNVSIRLAERVGLGESVTTALAQGFARWDGKGIPRGLAGEDISVAVRVVGIVDTAETFHRTAGVDGAVAALRKLGGVVFDPVLVESWCASAPEQLAILEADPWEPVSPPSAHRSLTESELDAALELIADYADLKSPWFCGHSRGVAALSTEAARHLGLPPADVTTIRRAALVHDIGRNGVSNAIWDKPGPLTGDEMEKVRLHAYYTGRVLARSGRLANLGQIASAAHERVGGSGYPRAIAGETIPLLGRILECADAYHAMLEDRPYRPALGPDAAARELRRMAVDGELDGSAVDAVLAAAGHRARKKPTAPAGLTPREIEVLEIAARGATTRQVASRLGIATKTAGNHIERIYSKIGCSSRAEAAMFAMEHGLLKPRDNSS
jgi:HD-GYP domain-containing protein (c-di-GMP phosphodiesterase class II)